MIMLKFKSAISSRCLLRNIRMKENECNGIDQENASGTEKGENGQAKFHRYKIEGVQCIDHGGLW